MLLPPLHRLAQRLQDPQRIVPAQAGVRDALAVSKLSRFVLVGVELLRARHEVTFNHHAKDAVRSGCELRCDIARHVDLALAPAAGGVDPRRFVLAYDAVIHQVPTHYALVQVVHDFAGGVVTSGMAMYDTMQYIRSPVSTVCVGQACSMGSLLLCAGAKGKRFSLPNSRIMIHQPSGGAQGQATDIEIQAREILKLRERLNQIYVKHTGQTLDKIASSVERDNFMSAEEAKAFGLIDEVVDKRPSSGEPTAKAA